MPDYALRCPSLVLAAAAQALPSLRLYQATVDGKMVLVGETYLQFIVNAWRSGRLVREIYPWHRPGKPDKFALDPPTWLPPPYGALFKLPAPQGKVLAVDDQRTSIAHDAAGREDGVDAVARVTIDIGTRAGAFVGMEVCARDTPTFRVRVNAATRNTATLQWEWHVGAGAPQPTVGTAITTHCPVAPDS